MRELAPIPTPETVLPLIKAAAAEGRMFEYRMTPQTRKHMAVDLFSLGAIIKVAEAISEANRVKFLGLAPNVGRMAMVALQVMR